MNARERYLATLSFGSPDRIPFLPGHGRESTRARWNREGLPADKDPIEHVRELLGIEGDGDNWESVDVDCRMLPMFEEKVLEHKDGHYIVQDWKGNVCEISDQFDITYLRSAKDFVTRRWIRCPVENRDDWEAMKARYNPEDSQRFPEDFAQRCQAAKCSTHPQVLNVSGPFWQLREWCGFEGLCMMMIEQPELVDEMADFWTSFITRMLQKVLAGWQFDCLYISEDMAYKEKSMISMDMVRRFCMPSWKAWSKLIKSHNVPLFDCDSDGFVGELIPLWIESGINVCDPLEVAAGCDIVDFRRRFGRSMAFRQGIDKRCIAKGGSIIREEMKRIEPVVKDGGYIPGCDHGVPSDVSWPNFVEYCRLLAEVTGWI
ncbi:MAG: hypothetical protein GXY38_07495 [Planctomycetes bacterium]|nr:hypothetical protein [Planctomycetota bacterium]